MTAPRVLDRRTLNRALLARQLLLRRHEMPALDAVVHLVALQAQAPTPPYLGLWTRIERFPPEDLSQLILTRRVVRAALLRRTIHVVAARDCLALRPLLQPVFDRGLVGNATHADTVRAVDAGALATAGRDLLQERPRTSKALGVALAQRWPDLPGTSLAHGVHHLVPTLQVPPRGIWGASGQATWTTVESWLGAPLDPAPSLAEMVLRYLAAFGPASVADVRQWSGLTGLTDVVDGLRPRLRVFRDEAGRELFDLPDAPVPEPDTPAPARFIPPFDNLLLSHADRTRVIADDHRPAVFTVNGIIKGTVLLDGFVAGTWRLDQRRGTASLVVETFAPLRPRDRSALGQEGARLLSFAASGADTHDVRFVQR